MIFELVVVSFACIGYVCSMLFAFILGAAMNYDKYRKHIEAYEQNMKLVQEKNYERNRNKSNEGTK